MAFDEICSRFVSLDIFCKIAEIKELCAILKKENEFIQTRSSNIRRIRG